MDKENYLFKTEKKNNYTEETYNIERDEKIRNKIKHDLYLMVKDIYCRDVCGRLLFYEDEKLRKLDLEIEIIKNYIDRFKLVVLPNIEKYKYTLIGNSIKSDKFTIEVYCNRTYFKVEKIKKSFQSTLRRRKKKLKDSDLSKKLSGKSFTEKEIKLVEEEVKKDYDKHILKVFQ